MLSEISQSQKDKYCTIPLYGLPRVVKFIEVENRIVIARERGNMQLLFNGYGLSVCEDVKVLKMDCHDSFMTM